MFEYFLYILPVIWALTSTLVALLLYRSSKAFFSQTESVQGRTRRVRLVGSIVIAAVVFLGLRSASPSRDVSPDDTVLHRAEFNALMGALADLRSASDALEVCLNMTAVSECREQVETLRAQASRSRAAINAMQPRDAPHA
jgi:hypothetical protein